MLFQSTAHTKWRVARGTHVWLYLLVYRLTVLEQTGFRWERFPTITFMFQHLRVLHFNMALEAAVQSETRWAKLTLKTFFFCVSHNMRLHVLNHVSCVLALVTLVLLLQSLGVRAFRVPLISFVVGKNFITLKTREVSICVG